MSKTYVTFRDFFSEMYGLKEEVDAEVLREEGDDYIVQYRVEGKQA